MGFSTVVRRRGFLFYSSPLSSGEQAPMVLPRLHWLVLAAASLLGGCGYNQIQSGDEQEHAAWSELVNQYQRRADLIPNRVNTVKGFGHQQRDVLQGITKARAKATSIQMTPQTVD